MTNIKCFFCGVVLTSMASWGEMSPYGICAHVTRSEAKAGRLEGTLTNVFHLGVGVIRSDFDATAVCKRTGVYDFSGYDKIVDALVKRGVALLPIFYATENPPQDLRAYADYLKTCIQHYGRKMPVVEIWNEANLYQFFKGADPLVYAEVLKVAYQSVKSVDPSIRVAFGGTAGVPLQWIRKVFEAGAANSFDVICIHPYSHPSAPEGRLDVQLEALQSLMREFGVGDKPVWITEIGWPTHKATIPYSSILLAGLKVARPEQMCWRVVLATPQVRGKVEDQTLAAAIADLLPTGSTVCACSQEETVRRLGSAEVDAVVYPFDETFPADTVDAVSRFVRAGGVLVDFGGVPCFTGVRDGEVVPDLKDGAALSKFPFGYCASWTDTSGRCPKELNVFATSVGLEKGVRQEPTGFKGCRFLTLGSTRDREVMIPLVSGRTNEGTEYVCAAVIRHCGGGDGAVVLSTLFPSSRTGTTTEANQARYLVRSLAISFAEGVESVFPYNLRADEGDPYYSEHHFGLVHANFCPKPAFPAYAQFIRMRPKGSVNLEVPWHDLSRRVFYPQWRRTDGKVCGMIWKVGTKEVRKLDFAAGYPIFYDMYGAEIPVRKSANGRYHVVISESPLYYVGATLQSGVGCE